MKNSLKEAKGMSYNLHFLRFVAAILVIMSHSFVLSTGSFEKEWFYSISDGQITMGAFAVGIFFLYSGFLIMRGMNKKPKILEFIIGRCVRIFPVLICVTIFVVFVIGPIATKIEVKKYFTNLGTYKYLLNSFFVLVHELPGVFKENTYTATVNGSLWTLPVEFLCYIGCYMLYRLNILEKRYAYLTLPIVIIGSVGWIIIAKKYNSEMLLTVLFPIICFYVGMLYSIYREYVFLNGKVALISLVGFVAVGMAGFMKIGFIIFLTYDLIYFAFGTKNVSGHMWKCGNWSYAMYLVGFPIQQLVVSFAGGKMNPYINIVLTVPFVVIISILFYEMVEKKVTECYKKKG